MVFAEKVWAVLKTCRHGEGGPEIARLLTETLKPFPDDTNHFQGETADHDLRTDNVWPASKNALPSLVAENNHRLTPRRAGILREQGTSQLRANAKHLKVISRDQLSLKNMSVYPGIDILDGRDFGECWILLFKLAVLIPGEGMLAPLTVCPREAVEAVRIAYRDRP